MMGFPSPIYGASFKLNNEEERMGYINEMFPSPIYGASFKQNESIDRLENEVKFPSPIYGASFKHS